MNLLKAVRFIRRSVDPVSLDTVIFFVTSVCNAKCGTCFYWQNLNQKGDLTFEEIEKVSLSMPRFKSLLLSGGEPTLRRRLPEIVGLFVKNNKIENLSMPTNGLLPDLVLDTAKGFVGLGPDLAISISLSIDGLGKTHDEIRGVPGNFEKALKSLEKLIALRDAGARNLTVNVTSVVCSRNFSEIEATAEFFLKNYDLDCHHLVLIRGEPMLQNLLISDKGAMDNFHKFHRELTYKYYKRRSAQGRGSRSMLGRVYEVGFGVETQDVTRRNFEKGAEWPFACLAAQIIGVIDWNGDVRSCELRKPVANLRQYGLDFGKLWNGPEIKKEIESIRQDKCFCTHGCFLQPSQAHNVKSAFVRGPLKGLYEMARRRLKSA